MKFAILGDVHLGCRNDSPAFHELFESFYTNTFIPYLVEHEIDTVFQLGDLFDQRKKVNFNTLAESKRYLFQPLENLGIKFHTLLGNHDLYFRESLSVSSSALLLNEFSNITVYENLTTIHLEDGTSIDIVPWICKENEEEYTQFIKESKSDLCFGHFEIQNFAMYKNMESQHGIPASIFQRYEGVYSGHYHTKSSRDNVHYVGTPYEMTWSDYNDPKGFHVFDTATRQLEFIESPYTIFERHVYNDELNDYSKFDISEFQKKFIKVVVEKKTDFYQFDLFLKKLYESNTHEIKILEDLSDFKEGSLDNESINIENTLDVLEGYIESVADESNKDSIKLFMKSLYLEALEAI
jgi:DNA repair exonuclease SbcCD nuclease subunit